MKTSIRGLQVLRKGFIRTKKQERAGNFLRLLLCVWCVVVVCFFLVHILTYIVVLSSIGIEYLVSG
jgi:hypothetical protein